MQKIFEKYFYPNSVCIVGASTKKGNLGYELTNSIVNYGYTGKILPVNPKADEIFGFKCYKSIPEIKDEIDLAIVMVPKKFVEESIQQLLDKNVKSIILITAGFKETGKTGEEAEKRIVEQVKNAGARLVGPNCMGIINTAGSIKLNATFVAEKPENGTTAFLSQSGAIGAAVLNSLRETDIRFSHFISVGNKADICENDLLEYWENDKNIGVITLYLESFVNGENFIDFFIKNKIKKPVIILKAGRTSSGIKAASSHTGALGSSDKVVDSVLKQFGIIRADTLNDLFNSAKGFENFPLPKGNKVAVVTNAGGPAILTVDSLEKNGLTLANLSDKTKEELRKIVHPEGSVNNPVDLLPGGDAESYKKVNELLVEDSGVDAVISVFVEPVMVKALPVIENINSIKSDKPIFQIVMPLPEFWEEYRHNSKTKRPLLRNPEDASVVISNLLQYSKNKIKTRLTKNSSAKFNSIFKNKNRLLTQEEIQALAKDYKIPIIENLLVNVDEIKNVNPDFPIVLKAVGEKIVHKSDLNGVILNIKNKEELAEKSQEMLKEFKTKNLEIDKFLIQPFVDPKFELLIGGFRDPSFGPMVMFGSGGKYVEFLQDTTMRSAFLSESDIEEMINGTKIGKIIQGVRGEKPIDLKIVKNGIRSVAQMMLDNDEISECDLNPLLVDKKNRAFAVDVRIKI